MHVIEMGGSTGGAGVRARCAVTTVVIARAAIAAVRMGFIRTRMTETIMPKRVLR